MATQEDVVSEEIQPNSKLRAWREWSRRTFLKAGVAATGLAGVSVFRHASRVPTPLRSVPTLDDLAGQRLTHRFRDLYSSPATQNEYGYVQAAKSVSGLTALSLPPFACCGVPDTPWSPGFLVSCELFLDGRILLAASPGGDEIAYQWHPHRFHRETRFDGLQFTTETFMPSKRRAAAQFIRVQNLGNGSRTIRLGFDMRAAVTKKTSSWLATSPGEADNAIHWDAQRGCLIFEAQHSAAVSVQGISPIPASVEANRMLIVEMNLGSGETKELHYVNAVESNRETAVSTYDALQGRFVEAALENERAFDSLIKAAFTPGNSEFSGYLPQLETDDETLWQIYQAGFRNLLFARRATPDSKYGTTYLTLGGRVLPTLSFPWDTSLTSLSLALLDPDPLRRLIETWFVEDMHQHLATDYVTGEGVGPWYGVNDMAIVRCAENYLKVTGDFGWLDKRIGDRTALEHLVAHATYWKQLDKNGDGLGDYGKLENLLEVVSTYLHQTAGMNAGNVYSMRFVADLLDRRGETPRASQLRGEATELARRINGMLYVDGKGWWKCRQPEGSYNEVRHCYDFLSVLDNMFGDLSEAQKHEMNRFCWDQLCTDYWMRALSPDDVDATWNIRPDHSWLGAYAAWPPMTAKGLYRIAPQEKVAGWLRNVVKAVNQGPIGQAHFTETAFPLEHGGAYKCPTDAPYLNDWCCISAGAFTDLVIDTIFGAQLTLFDGIKVRSRLNDFDSKARLVNLRYQTRNYALSENAATLAR